MKGSHSKMESALDVSSSWSPESPLGDAFVSAPISVKIPWLVEDYFGWAELHMATGFTRIDSRCGEAL